MKRYRLKIITAFKQEQERDILICNNRQCMACEYLVGRSNSCTCNYLGMTDHSRGCDIPFCKRFKLKKGKRTPKHLTKKDFANWYRISNWQKTKRKGGAMATSRTIREEQAYIRDRRKFLTKKRERLIEGMADHFKLPT